MKSWGVVERPDGDIMRFALEATPKVAPQIYRLVVGPDASEATDGETHIEVDPARLPEFVEGAIHLTHLNEVVLVPVTTWGAIVNITAYDLATDDSWLEIDAEASLHQNRRDPLAVDSRDMHILTAMTKALMEHADSPNEDLAILATGASLVMELMGRTKTLRIWSANDMLRERLREQH
ncbi:MAG: hypothetical protein EA376_00945 [Phycisphaeraceae bacterium]|nr:MAG: hypothetical protein EA376_00945 [Phycisphaeraceae bacterium]